MEMIIYYISGCYEDLRGKTYIKLFVYCWAYGSVQIRLTYIIMNVINKIMFIIHKYTLKFRVTD